MSDVNWIEVYRGAGETEDLKELTHLLKENGVTDIFKVFKQAVGSYAWGRDYREGRGQSMKALRAENATLKKAAAGK